MTAVISANTSNFNSPESIHILTSNTHVHELFLEDVTNFNHLYQVFLVQSTQFNDTELINDTEADGDWSYDVTGVGTNEPLNYLFYWIASKSLAGDGNATYNMTHQHISDYATLNLVATNGVFANSPYQETFALTVAIAGTPINILEEYNGTDVGFALVSIPNPTEFAFNFRQDIKETVIVGPGD